MRLIAVGVCPGRSPNDGDHWKMTSFQFFPENVMTSVLLSPGTPFWVLVALTVARPDRASADRDALATWWTIAAVSNTGPRVRLPGAVPVPPALATTTATATAAAAAVSPVPASTAPRGSRRARRGSTGSAPAPVGPAPVGPAAAVPADTVLAATGLGPAVPVATMRAISAACRCGSWPGSRLAGRARASSSITCGRRRSRSPPADLVIAIAPDGEQVRDGPAGGHPGNRRWRALAGPTQRAAAGLPSRAPASPPPHAPAGPPSRAPGGAWPGAVGRSRWRS